jgi:hypothetical protein
MVIWEMIVYYWDYHMRIIQTYSNFRCVILDHIQGFSSVVPTSRGKGLRVKECCQPYQTHGFNWEHL